MQADPSTVAGMLRQKFGSMFFIPVTGHGDVEMVVVDRDRQSRQCAPSIRVQACVSVLEKLLPVPELLRPGDGLLHQQFQFQALLDRIFGIWDRPGQGHGRRVEWKVRASATCGMSASPFNMSRQQFLTGQHERRRLHPSAGPERRVDRAIPSPKSRKPVESGAIGTELILPSACSSWRRSCRPCVPNTTLCRVSTCESPLISIISASVKAGIRMIASAAGLFDVERDSPCCRQLRARPSAAQS